MPKVDGPSRKAYHLTVSTSPMASGRADFKKAKTSSSFPALASTLARIANFSIVRIFRLFFWRNLSREMFANCRLPDILVK